MKEQKKVLITRKIPEPAKSMLEKAGFKVITGSQKRSLAKDELIKKAKSADAIISMLSDKFDAEVIEKLDRCKIIANYAVGYNNIDVEFANSRGITVTNTPDILTDATADIAFGLAIAAARNFIAGDELVRAGKFNGWEPELLLGKDFKNKVFGIVGAGRIGQATAKRAKAFGCKIVYFSRTRKPDFEKETRAKKVSLNRLLKISDFISLHVPLTDKTSHLLNSENMANIKKGAVIINTARGEIIDEKVLIKMLKNGDIFAAGLDVYENEPNVKKEFLKMKNVVLLPHLGSGTFETRSEMAKLAAKNVINVLNGKKPVTPVR